MNTESEIMEKPRIDNQYPVTENIAKRWSPRAFSNRPLEKVEVMSLIEAARWSSSCFNEQPWRFTIGFKGDTWYDKIMDTLVEFNQNWAKTAPVLMLVKAKKTFTQNGKNNIHSWYDTGQAMGNLAVQATSMGIYLHQMAGFDRHKAEAEIINDTDYEAICVAAIGYPGDIDQLPNSLQESEYKAQQRKPLADFIDIL